MKTKNINLAPPFQFDKSRLIVIVFPDQFDRLKPIGGFKKMSVEVKVKRRGIGLKPERRLF